MPAGARHITFVVGARPNFMKAAPVYRGLAELDSDAELLLVHTGQHYDVAMNERLFADLEMPPPDLNLEVGSGSHAMQTAEIMRRFEPVLDELAYGAGPTDQFKDQSHPLDQKKKKAKGSR
jgi:UDP-N-acetylglucosamine 2-epimerase (non-hydrolysing)